MNARIPRIRWVNTRRGDEPLVESPPRSKPPANPFSLGVRCSVLTAIARFLHKGFLIVAAWACVVGAQAQVSIDSTTPDSGNYVGQDYQCSMTMPAFTPGSDYSYQFTASGGTPPYTFNDVCPYWHPNFSLASDGTFSGNDSNQDIFVFPVTAVDADNNSVTVLCTIQSGDMPPPATITISGSLTGGVTSQGYSQTLYAGGGSGPYSWSVASGSLPDGLSLDPSSGTISGTPTASGTFSFTVAVTDANSAAGSADYQITVYDPPSISGSLPDGMVNVAYSQGLMLSGGSGSYSCSLSGQPGGLQVDSTGTISGTPTTAGTYYLTVTVTDSQSGLTSQAAYGITIGPVPIAVSNVTVTANSTTSVTVSYTVAMPYGGDSCQSDFYLGRDGCSPSLCGSYTPDGNGQVVIPLDGLDPTQGYFFTVQTTANIPGVGSYSVWDGSGGFQIQANSIVQFSSANYQANENDGTVTITVTRSEDYSRTESVNYGGDSTGTVTFYPGESSQSFSFSIYDDGVYNGNQSYTFTLSDPQGGTSIGSPSTATLTVVETDSPPPPPPDPGSPPADPPPTVTLWGLQVDAVSATTATISWAASVSGEHDYWWNMGDPSSGGAWVLSWSETWTASPDNNTISYSGSGGSGSATGGYDPNSGRASVTFTGLTPGQTYSFTATSGYGGVSASQDGQQPFTTTPTFSITTGSLPDATMGSYYSTSLGAGGGSGSGYSWSASGLPEGLSCDSSGNITGSPTTTGSYTVSVSVSDDGGNSTSTTLGLYVDYPPPTITASLPDGIVGIAYSGTLSISSSYGSLGVHFVSGGLPDGLSWDGSTVSGTPTTAGTYNFTINADDGMPGGYAQADFQITIASPVSIAGPPTVSSVDSDSATISWTVNNATGQALQNFVNWTDNTISTSGQVEGDTDVNSGTVSITVQGLQANHSYSFWVQSGTGDQSFVVTSGNHDGNTFGFNTPVLMVTISNVTATAISSTNALVAWSVDTTSTTLSSNVVYYWNDPATTNTVMADYDSDQGFAYALLTGLTANTSYQFTVFSDTGLGVSASSNGVFSTPSAFWVGNVTLGTSTPESQQILWSLVNDTGLLATNSVYYWLAGSTDILRTQPEDDAGLGAVSVTLSGLQPNQTYDYYVVSETAVDSASAPPNAGWNQFTTPARHITITSTPQLSAVQNDGTATVSWTIQTDSTASIQNTVSYSWAALDGTSGSGTASVQTSAGVTSISVPLTGVQPGATYAISASSVVVGQEDQAGYNVLATNSVVAPLVAPIAISNIASTADETGAVITWNVAKTDPTLTAQHYVAFANSTTFLSDTNMLVVAGSEDQNGQVTAVLTGLTPDETYYYFVQSVVDFTPAGIITDANNGQFYSFITQIGIPPSPPDSPNISITSQPLAAVNFRNVFISWNVSNLTTANASHYVVFSPDQPPSGTNATVFAATEDPAGFVSASMTNLPAGRTYYFYVQSMLDCLTNNFATNDNSGAFYTFTTDANIAGDGLPDSWKTQNNIDVTSNQAYADPDGDGRTNFQEYRDGTNPNAAYTLEGQALPDGRFAAPCPSLTFDGTTYTVGITMYDLSGNPVSYDKAWDPGIIAPVHNTNNLVHIVVHPITPTISDEYGNPITSYGVWFNDEDVRLWRDPNRHQEFKWGDTIQDYAATDLWVEGLTPGSTEITVCLTAFERGACDVVTINFVEATLTSDPEPRLPVCPYTAWFETDNGKPLKARCTAIITAQYAPDPPPDGLKANVTVVPRTLATDTTPSSSAPSAAGQCDEETPGSVWEYTAFTESLTDKYPCQHSIRLDPKVGNAVIYPISSDKPLTITVPTVFDWFSKTHHKDGPGADKPYHEPTNLDCYYAYLFIRYKYKECLDNIFLHNSQGRFSNVDFQPASEDSPYAETDILTRKCIFYYKSFLCSENYFASTVGHELVHTTQYGVHWLAVQDEAEAFKWELDNMDKTGAVQEDILNTREQQLGLWTLIFGK